MAIRLIVSFNIVPGKGADFMRAFAPVIAEVRAEAGCEQYELFSNPEEPDHVVLLERWSDQASLDAHSAASRARGPSPTTPFRRGGTIMERYDM